MEIVFKQQQQLKRIKHAHIDPSGQKTHVDIE